MAERSSIGFELIKQAVNRLKRLGFRNVNENNITTDEVYSFYFFKMLKEMLGESQEKDEAIQQLLEMVNNHISPNSKQKNKKSQTC